MIKRSHASKSTKPRDHERLAARPTPVRIYARHSSVEVYLGCGWKKGSVISSDRDGCSVWLGSEQRMTRCFDNRNIRPAS
jgi:hypothetical protein